MVTSTTPPLGIDEAGESYCGYAIEENRPVEVRRNPEACPIVNAVHAIGEQYRLLVVYNLRDDEMRFNELKRAMGASSRTLSQALDALQEEGIVTRRSEEADPIAVYYGLTEKGRALESVFDELADWGEQFADRTADPVPADD